MAALLALPLRCAAVMLCTRLQLGFSRVVSTTAVTECRKYAAATTTTACRSRHQRGGSRQLWRPLSRQLQERPLPASSHLDAPAAVQLPIKHLHKTQLEQPAPTDLRLHGRPSLAHTDLTIVIARLHSLSAAEAFFAVHAQQMRPGHVASFMERLPALVNNSATEINALRRGRLMLGCARHECLGLRLLTCT
jgi:hypothetical protein